jgi:hypothetical protein
MGNRDNYFTNGLLFLVLGNLSDSWVKYVVFTVGTMFIVASLGNAQKDKRESNE